MPDSSDLPDLPDLSDTGSENSLQKMQCARSRTVLLVDYAQHWVRHPSDLFGAILTFLSLVFVILFSFYASATTLAIESDIRHTAASLALFQQLLLLPINFLESVVSFLLPLFALVLTVWHKRWRTLITALISGILSLVTVLLAAGIADTGFSKSFFMEIAQAAPEVKSLDSTVPFLAMVSAVLIVSGNTKNFSYWKTSWCLLGTVLLFSVLQGRQSLTGALTALLTGIFIGLFMRWLIGSEPRHASGAELVRMVREAGIDAVEIIRLNSAKELPGKKNAPLEAFYVKTTDTTVPLGSNSFFNGSADKSRELNLPVRAKDADPLRLSLRAQQYCKIPDSQVNSRIYYAQDICGNAHQLLVIDEDQRIIGVLASFWQRIRLKHEVGQGAKSLPEIAQQMILMLLLTERLGITPQTYRGVAASECSVLLSLSANPDPLLSELDPGQIHDEQLDLLWLQLQKAHRAGLKHSRIDANHIMLKDGRLLLYGWDAGAAIASEYEQQIDLAQFTAMLATVFGIERTVAFVKRMMPLNQIVAFAPFLQYAILPEATRAAFADKKDFLNLREAIIAEFPQTSAVKPVVLQRFSGKTIATVLIGAVTLFILLGSLNFTDISVAIRRANPILLVCSFIAALFTYLGGAIMLKAYVRERIKLSESVLVQVAASLITLIVPAGVGPAALNLRFLQKRGLSTALALATATLIQLSQLAVTFLLLLVLLLCTGSFNPISGVHLSGTVVLILLGIILLSVAVLVLFPQLRSWIWNRAEPTIKQIWPRLLWLGAHPQRLFYGFLGTLISTAGFVSCFSLALLSFGESLPIPTLAITYLIANSVGSALPSPGGIGPVEAALTGGLVIAGVPSSIAFSTAVVYRLFTFWGRAPLGWLALRLADKKQLI